MRVLLAIGRLQAYLATKVQQATGIREKLWILAWGPPRLLFLILYYTVGRIYARYYGSKLP